MWGAIIQAIDHAMGRMHEGAGAGIKVANSQSGGGAPISNPDSGAGNASKLGQDLRNKNEGTSEQAEAAEEAKIGSNSTSTGEAPKESGQSEGGSGIMGNLGNIGGEGLGDAGNIEGLGSSILSDANAKTAQGIGVGGSIQEYGANLGKGMANAGAVAQGKGAPKWDDVNKDNAKNAAEKVVTSWRKKDFNKSSDDQLSAPPQGK